MKYIKLYENLEEKPKIDDYILVNTSYINIQYQAFLNNTIGKITNLHPTLGKSPGGFVSVEYKNIPSKDILYIFKTDNLEINNTVIPVKDIIYFSKNKKDVEAILASKKYNL